MGEGNHKFISASLSRTSPVDKVSYMNDLSVQDAISVKAGMTQNDLLRSTALVKKATTIDK